MKKQLYLHSFLLLFAFRLPAQMWVDSLFATQDTLNVAFGTATDFAGNERELLMDITVPVGDTPPVCGRPLMVLVHGGSFMAGSKENASIAAMRRKFAERGYVTAAVNYRLGMIQTDLDFHCNVSYFPGVEWDCLNQTDTLEWNRALFRGIQDTKGAIRFLVNHRSIYNIDPNNVFVVGESAGGFIALGTGYLDDPSEYPTGVGIASTPLPPHIANYEARCVQGYGFDTSVASMNLTRPDLGNVEGDLNPTGVIYKIKGVGNFYGAMIGNYLQVNPSSEIPVLYMYHQPNDLIVPYNRSMVLAGYAYCMTFLGCVYIKSRPYVNGSDYIRDLIESRILLGLPAPIYQFDSTLNNANCSEQIADPNKTGHAIDHFALRTGNMATFFSTHIVCLTGQDEGYLSQGVEAYPNPTSGTLQLRSHESTFTSISLWALDGRKVLHQQWDTPQTATKLELPAHLPDGIYHLAVSLQDGTRSISKVVVNR